MEHEQYLLELLRPLGVYDLSARSVNRGELGVYGKGLDEGGAQLEQLLREAVLTTAEGFGLEQVEGLLPYRPVSDTVEDRRRALAALLRIGGDSFTLAAINDTLSGCGINAVAAEGNQPGYVEVYFPDVGGIPEGFAALREIVEEILPCHLEITYIFWYNTWGTLAQRVSTWGGAEATGKSWYALAAWK
jgi:hypothetical protein